MRKNKYKKSNELLKKVKKVIPLGSQTFSKSYLQYIKGQAPLFTGRAKGAHIWDIDGNRYVDMINALLPVILGYQYPAVDNTIKSQLKKGIIFSLPSPLEYELARLLIKHIPCAEMVRFGKNGSDATTGAIRVARAYTGRDYVVVCGYHGWHDWYIGSTTRDLGVPKATKDLTLKFFYNDIESLKNLFKKYPGKIAAVIMEPMNYVEPEKDFLEEVKKITHKGGALLVFDEIICGFRYSLGGAQKYFRVTPDLATFGKSMANGMPISALVGKRKYMKTVDKIFYSFTQGGEALSIAAAIATIKEIEKKKVIPYIWKLGKHLQNNTNKLLKKYDLDEFIQVKGKPCWQVFIINPVSGHEGSQRPSATNGTGYSALQIKSFIQQEVLRAGFLWYGSHNMSFSHTKPQMEKLLKFYDGIFAELKTLIENKTLEKRIEGGLITDIFKVR